MVQVPTPLASLGCSCMIPLALMLQYTEAQYSPVLIGRHEMRSGRDDPFGLLIPLFCEVDLSLEVPTSVSA